MHLQPYITSIPVAFPVISESPAIQSLATRVASTCSHLQMGSIVQCLPQVMKSLHSDTSRRVYLQDILHFATWLASAQITLTDLTYEHMTDYYVHLENDRSAVTGKKYATATINRMFAVASRILQEHVRKGLLGSNPCKDVDQRKGVDETTHAALNADQSKQLLATIDSSTLKGKRDYALVSLLLRTGIRRDECRMLTIGAIKMMQGHHIAILENAKGGERQIVKLPPDVWCYIEEYVQALQEAHPRRDGRLEAPLFLSFRRGDHPSLKPDTTGKLVEQRIDVKAIEQLVIDLGIKIGVPDLTPHGLRASFITLALENGATLTETQYAARHKDPRTTERYHKRKLNLDRNAVDKLSFLSREI